MILIVLIIIGVIALFTGWVIFFDGDDIVPRSERRRITVTILETRRDAIDEEGKKYEIFNATRYSVAFRMFKLKYNAGETHEAIIAPNYTVPTVEILDK